MNTQRKSISLIREKTVLACPELRNSKFSKSLIENLANEEIEITDPEITLVEKIEKYKISGLVPGGFFGIYANEVYYFSLHCAQIPLPEDYEHTLFGICQVLSHKLCKLAPDDDIKLKKKIFSFLEAVKQIIYNISLDVQDLYATINYYIARLHTELTDSYIKNLNHFLDTAEIVLKMPQKVKRLLFFEQNLQVQRELLIEKLLNQKELKFDSLSNDFLSLFSNFIKDSEKFLAKSVLNDYYQEQIRDNEKIISSVKIGLTNSLMQTIQGQKFQRVGIFSYKLTENRKITESNWVLLLSLILQTESISLERPVNLASRKLLIPLLSRSGSYLIFYSLIQPPKILRKFESSSITVAQGSTYSGALITDRELQSNFYYSLNHNEFLQDFNFNLEFSETVTSVVYIEQHNKAVYIINEKYLYVQKMNSNTKVEIRPFQDPEKLLLLYYSKEFNYVCLKSQKKLVVFNEYMQILKIIEIEGTDFIGLKDNGNGWFWVINENCLAEIRFSYNCAANSLRKSFMIAELEKCKNSMSFDFISEVKGCSKYSNFLLNTFKVPDFDKEFKKFLNQPSSFFSPSQIEISVWANFGKFKDLNSDSVLATFKPFNDSLGVVTECEHEYEEEKSLNSSEKSLNNAAEKCQHKTNSTLELSIDSNPAKSDCQFSSPHNQLRSNSCQIKFSNESPKQNIFNYITQSSISNIESSSSSPSSSL